MSDGLKQIIYSFFVLPFRCFMVNITGLPSSSLDVCLLVVTPSPFQIQDKPTNHLAAFILIYMNRVVLCFQR